MRRLAGALLAAPAPAAAPTRGGRLVTTTRVHRRYELTIVDRGGLRHRLPWRRPERLIDGAPLRRTAWAAPDSLAVASDGSLVFLIRDELAAVIPADSPRPRVALTAQTEDLFDQGALGYRAGDRGRLRLEVRYGGRIVAAGATPTAGGEGRLTFPAFQAPGLYLVRLRLTTAHGTAEDRLWIDRRSNLSEHDGKAAIVAAYVRTVGDRAAGHAITTAGCDYGEEHVVGCFLLRRDHAGDLYSGGRRYRRTLRPYGFAYASRPAGAAIATTLRRIPLTLPRVAVGLPRVPRHHAATLRRWLAGPRRVFALLTVTVRTGDYEPSSRIQVMRATRLEP